MKQAFFPTLSWRSLENKVCASTKQGFSQHYALLEMPCLAPEFHQSTTAVSSTVYGILGLVVGAWTHLRSQNLKLDLDVKFRHVEPNSLAKYNCHPASKSDVVYQIFDVRYQILTSDVKFFKSIVQRCYLTVQFNKKGINDKILYKGEFSKLQTNKGQFPAPICM